MEFEKDEGQCIGEKREWKKKKKVKVTEINQSKGKLDQDRVAGMLCTKNNVYLYAQRTEQSNLG